MWSVLTKVHVCIALAPFLFCSSVAAEERRSIETEQEEEHQFQEVEKFVENERAQESPTFLKRLIEKTTLSGSIDFGYNYADVSDVSEENSGGTSDLVLDSVELALWVIFNNSAKSKIAVTADDVGVEGGEDKITLDEAIFTVESPWMPFYFTGGKTILPFGVFEDHLVVGTLTEELYEIDTVGATLGFSPDFYGLDISITIYEGQNIIENLEEFGTHEFRPDRKQEDDVSSFIINVTLEPVKEMLTFSVFYDGEPGDGKRRQSLGAALTLDAWKFSLDAEYIAALKNEEGADGEENKESAWVIGLAFQPFESVPLELAVRYEGFNDDRQGNQDEILDYRYPAGFSYSFLNYATFFFEYRHSSYEKEPGSNAADKVNELHFRIVLAF